MFNAKYIEALSNCVAAQPQWYFLLARGVGGVALVGTAHG